MFEIWHKWSRQPRTKPKGNYSQNRAMEWGLQPYIANPVLTNFVTMETFFVYFYTSVHLVFLCIVSIFSKFSSNYLLLFYLGLSNKFLYIQRKMVIKQINQYSFKLHLIFVFHFQINTRDSQHWNLNRLISRSIKCLVILIKSQELYTWWGFVVFCCVFLYPYLPVPVK